MCNFCTFVRLWLVNNVLSCNILISMIFYFRGVSSHGTPVIYPLFHTESPVKDISNGSLDVLHFFLRQSSLSFVMYYAHWCARSVELVYDFHRVSKKFKGQVYIWGKNCIPSWFCYCSGCSTTTMYQCFDQNFWLCIRIFFQVSFIAINCWAGSCRNKDFPQSYPQLYLYHTKYEPVHYKGRHKFTNLVSFVVVMLMVILTCNGWWG
jgi:hypothetical protein